MGQGQVDPESWGSLIVGADPTEVDPADAGEFDVSAEGEADLGVAGAGFEPDLEIAAWVEVAGLEAELEADAGPRPRSALRSARWEA